jgi:Lysine methyltransferase
VYFKRRTTGKKRIYRNEERKNDRLLQGNESAQQLNDEMNEEIWVNEGGVNIFDAILDNPLQERQLWLPSRSLGLRYRSFLESKLTPLNLNYDGTVEDEFYDGTGTMVWLAARALAWSLDQDIHQIYSARLCSSYPPADETTMRPKLICELGCGTGMAGLAALLLAAVPHQQPPTDCEERSGSQHLWFTDNDQESLDNCKVNCLLNELPDSSYSHHRLSWGMPETYPPGLIDKVDVILATDVLYDLKMALPLFQTTATLLRGSDCSCGTLDVGDDNDGRSSGGMMILSHVPRFCLPRDQNPSNPSLSPSMLSSTGRQSYRNLEEHLVELARSVGLHLVEQFRPHELLVLPSNCDRADMTNTADQMVSRTIPIDTLQRIDIDQLEQAHSIIYVFQKREILATQCRP